MCSYCTALRFAVYGKLLRLYLNIMQNVNTIKFVDKLSAEDVTVIYIFASHLMRDLLSKERICSSWSKFFLLIVNPSLDEEGMRKE